MKKILFLCALALFVGACAHEAPVTVVQPTVVAPPPNPNQVTRTIDQDTTRTIGSQPVIGQPVEKKK